MPPKQTKRAKGTVEEGATGFCDDKHFPTSCQREGHGFLSMEFKSFFSEIHDTQVDLLHQDESVHQPVI
jgi:hypothetical protein